MNEDALVIIPAYNEGKSIESTIMSLQGRYDFVVINDCSTDDTRQVCIDNDLNYIDLPINLGIGGAVQTGYKYAFEKGYKYAIQFDGDGQHNAEYIEDLLEVLKKDEADMVIGSRYLKKKGFQSSFMRRLGINFFKRLIRFLSKATITDATSGFRASNQKVIALFAQDYPQDYPEPQTNLELVVKGYRVKEIPVVMNERMEGESSITPIKSVYFMLKVSMAILVEYFQNR